MDLVAQSHEFSGGNQHANRNSTLHPSTTNSSSVLRDDDTISLVSTPSVQAEDALGPVSSDINTSPGIVGGVRFRNSIAQSNAHIAQLNHESESQHPSEETLMMSDHGSSDDSNSQKRSWKYNIKKAARGWWLWEIGGAALSIGCMIAILVIIPYLHNQPLENWRLMIAPNTMISTLITISKTSMLLSVAAGMGQLKWQHFHRHTRPISELDIYDEASRGPWGALVFMFISPFHWRDMVAILGAFVMLSSLTMEPLAQQLLSFQTRYIVQHDNNTWISTVTTYVGKDSGDFPQPHCGEHSRLMRGTDALDVPAEHLILKGLLGSPPLLSYTCSSSNCSWSDFPSLGVCSSCTNVTSNCSVKVIPDQDRTFHEANYTTSRGITLPITASVFGHAIPAIVMSGNMTKKGRMNFTDIAFVAMANASGPSVWDHSISEYKYRQPDITECRISWCARFYSGLKMVSGHVSYGFYPLTIATSKTNGTFNSYTTEEKVFTSTEIHPYDVSDVEVGFEGFSGSYPMFENVTFWTKWRGKYHQFTVGLDSILSVPKYFEEIFNFQVYTDDTSLTYGKLLANTESVPAAMDAITDAFSIYLMTSTPNTRRHYGEAFYPEVFVAIRWQWLVFPGLLTILGAFFLGTSLWISRMYRTSFLWKDSLVPLLFHGLSGWNKNELHTNDKMEMDERAERMKAKLSRDEDGTLKFVKA